MDRLYALLLRAFPREQRMRHGAEILDALRRERARLRGERSISSLWRFDVAAMVDIVGAGLAERHRGRRNRGTAVLAGVGHDVRHALRALGRSWVFTLVCVTSLAVGLAINSAILFLMLMTVGAPPGVEDEGMVEVLVTDNGRTAGRTWSHPDFVDMKGAQIGLDLTAWALGKRNVRLEDGGDGPAVVAMYVSSNYFRTLGMTMSSGRGFLSEEDGETAEPPVVVSEWFWRARLGEDPDVVGRQIRMNRVVHRVIGVTPRGFDGHRAGQSVDVWVPLWEHPLVGIRGALSDDRHAERIEVLGRLQPGVGMAQANGALAGVMRGLSEEHPATHEGRGAVAVPYAVQGGGSAGALVLTTLFMAPALLVLLVVSLNLAGMSVVRNATRERELALRLALGSSRGRLFRHLLTESVLLAIAGCALGVVVFRISLPLILLRNGARMPEGMDPSLIGLFLVLTVVTTMAVGLVPALRFSRPALLHSIKDDTGAGSRRSGWVHRIAISAQVAVALPALVIIGMILQATRVMGDADYGFQPANLFVSTVDVAVEGYSGVDAESFVRGLLDGVAAVPGVEQVSLADGIPLDYERRTSRVARTGDAEFRSVRTTRTGVGYLRAIGTDLIDGRAFDEGDVAGNERVAVVTASFAEQSWPGESALGQRLRLAVGRNSETQLTVVGVVRDVAGSSHESQPVNLFVPLAQHPADRVTLVIRARSEDATIARAIQDAMVALDPGLVRPTVQTARSLMDAPRQEILIGSTFVGSLALLTLLLAAIGVYGVVAFAVASRTREIGVRMAIGASRDRVMAGVLADGATLAVPGIAIGSVLAIILARQMLARWYAYLDRTTFDPVTLAVGACVALATVLLASGLPARRAASLDPMVALRRD